MSPWTALYFYRQVPRSIVGILRWVVRSGEEGAYGVPVRIN